MQLLYGWRVYVTVYEIAVTESGGILSNSLREMTAYGEFYLQNIDFDDYDSPIILTEDVDAIEVGSVMDWNLFEAVSGGTTMDIYTTPARPRAGILPGVLMTTGTEGVHAIIANLSEDCEMYLLLPTVRSSLLRLKHYRVPGSIQSAKIPKSD